LRLTTNLTTVVEQRTYSVSDGFPADAIGIFGVVDASGIALGPISRSAMANEVSAGRPSGYYIYKRNTIGFDVPASDVQTFRIDYLGFGVQATEETDEVLPSIPQVEDDDLWDAIIFEVAHVYHRRLIMNDTTEDNRHSKLAAYYRKEANLARYHLMMALNNMNYDKGLEIKLDEDYWGYLQRTGPSYGLTGDVVTVF